MSLSGRLFRFSFSNNPNLLAFLNTVIGDPNKRVVSNTTTDVVIEGRFTKTVTEMLACACAIENVGTAGGIVVAAGVTVTPSGNLTSTDVQAALEEHQGDLNVLLAIGAANYFAIEVDPGPGDFVDGDFAINVISGDVFGPKASGVWPPTIGNAYNNNLALALPEPNGAAAVGTSILAAREDHVHALEPMQAEVTGSFTALLNTRTPVDVSSVISVVTPPAGAVVGDSFTILDSQANAAVNNITIDFIGAGQLLFGISQNVVLNQNGSFARFHFVNVTAGWAIEG